MESILKLREIIMIGILFGMLSNVEAQQKGSFRFGLDFGSVLSSSGETFGSNIEAKYNLTDKSNVGLRFERGLRYSVKNSNIAKKDLSNYSVTYDNYFHKEGASSAAFLGAGLGIYKIKSFQEADFFGLKGFREVSDESKIGFMIRGGIELGKVRLALEYNLVPKTEFDGVEIKNNYVGISIGFYLGGGKWKRLKKRIESD